MATAIEKNVPVAPIHRHQLEVQRKYPFPDMEVGDSFIALLADSRSDTLEKLRGTLLACARLYFGKHGHITTRRLADGSGFRVWRKA